MDGPALIKFTISAVPQLVHEVLQSANMTIDDVDLYLFHQATRKVLEQLQERLEIDKDRMPISLENCGNTVSSTLPVLIDEYRRIGRIRPGERNMLVGFGVGWSWAGCIWQDTWTR